MSMMAAGVIALLAAADLPPGFQKTLVNGTMGEPMVLDFLPDGRMVVAQRWGQIALLDQGQKSVLLMITNTTTDEEWGVLGMAVDPDFANNHYIYFYYTTQALECRVSRFTVTGGTADPGSELVIWQNPQLGTAPSHHGGNIAFGPDGKLYIACGEEMDSVWAQDLSSQRGKILRINKDGSIPPDNPFAGTPGADPRIWALGFRNPFRFCFDTQESRLYVGDVGNDQWEEVTLVGEADNAGWPAMEGYHCFVADCSAYDGPVWGYQHCDPNYAPGCECAVILGPVYRGTQFPAPYQGSLFVADHINGWMRRLSLDATGHVTGEEVFDDGPELYTVVDMKVGPDGALYYTCVFNGDVAQQPIYRIAYVGTGNQPPVAVATAFPTQASEPPLVVHFIGSDSYDPDGPAGNLTYSWDFDDGDTSTQADPTHTYTFWGYHRATLTVSDGELSSTVEVPITVGTPPVPTMDQPADGAQYRAGDTITFSGSGFDAEDGFLTPDALSWRVTVVHDTHTHPFLGPVDGVAGGSFQIPTTGHPPENIHFRIALTATDSDLIPATVTHEIYPVISPLTLGTSPQGVALSLDGNFIDTPRVYNSVVNFQHVLTAPDRATFGGVEHYFVTWSDGEPSPVHALVSPEGGLTLTATYAPFCYSDFDRNTFVNGDDFDSFIAAFEAGDQSADVDGNMFVNGDDFDSFMDAFVAGC